MSLESAKKLAGLGLVSAFATNLQNPKSAFAQQSVLDPFKRGIPYDIDSLPEILLEETKSQTTLAIDEERQILDQLANKYPFLRGKQGKFKEAYGTLVFKLEPDTNYANNLIKEAEISIDHIFKFLRSSYIRKPEIDFIVPSKKEEIRLSEHQKIPFYLVSYLKTLTQVIYKFEIGESKVDVKDEFRKDNFGRQTTHVQYTVGDKDSLKFFKKTPILYNTSQPKVILVETPAIETLHAAVHDYTFKHIEQSFSSEQPSSISNMTDVVNRHNYLEEIFVHALSILWLKKYVIERNLGLTERELNGRFAMYDDNPIYIGTNKLAQHIGRIGIQKAIELYVTNPDQLFKVLK